MSLNPKLLPPGILSAMQRKPVPLIGSAKAKAKEKPEPADACPLGEEIRLLHLPTIQWANLHEILYDYFNPTKKATGHKGRSDFLFMRNGRCCACEYKALANPDAGLSDDQREWIAWAARCGVKTLVTNSFSEMTKFVIKELRLEI